MATVITSRASALPRIGHAVVAWLWGGLKKQSPPFKNFAYCGKNLLSVDYNSLIWIESVKMSLLCSQKSVGQFAGVCDWHGLCVTHNGFQRCVSTQLLSRKYANNAAPQRLDAKQQAWLVGLYEADGWFGVFRNGKYVQYECGLELSIKDVPLLHQIKNVLSVSGSIRPRKDRPDMVTFKIRNKEDLRTKIVPIFESFPMISAKRYQFENFKKCLCHQNIIYSADLEKHGLISYKEIKYEPSVKTILSVPYFNEWLVGFINGEGCFSTYKPAKDKSLVCAFEIGHTVNGSSLCKAIRRKFRIRAQIYKNVETGHFKIKTSSVKAVKNVLYFLTKSKIPLKGHKHLQFVLWVQQLRMIPRYANHIKIPQNL